MKKDDPRVIRTRQIIKDAFRALLKTKGFDAITIKDIAERATINRATFYAHYEDKYALLDEIIVQTFENMLPEQIIQAQEFTEDICRQFIELTYNYIVMFSRTCKHTTKSITQQIYSKVKHILYETIKSILEKKNTAINASINATMISAAIYSAAYYWYESKFDDNIKQLTDTVVSFIINGLQADN
ncbi:TetR/AcrR family transcriptional regulator [Clostridium isatidis]|uniref:TetR/AcrR family transcriptional regulator n=1 Tax=Clostridium isatidis TaxID=182773 RepID=UPI003AAAF92C